MSVLLYRFWKLFGDLDVTPDAGRHNPLFYQHALENVKYYARFDYFGWEVDIYFFPTSRKMELMLFFYSPKNRSSHRKFFRYTGGEFTGAFFRKLSGYVGEHFVGRDVENSYGELFQEALTIPGAIIEHEDFLALNERSYASIVVDMPGVGQVAMFFHDSGLESACLHLFFRRGTTCLWQKVPVRYVKVPMALSEDFRKALARHHSVLLRKTSLLVSVLNNY